MKPFLLDTAITERLEGVSDFRIIGRSASRLLGAFYTDTNATDVMAEWVIRRPGDKILEPSFGDGAFLKALRNVARSRGYQALRLFGAELIQEPFSGAIEAQLLNKKDSFLGDFLSVQPFEVDAITGNPPYVRLRHLPPDQMNRALQCASSVLHRDMDPSGSIWMPFILHGLRFLRKGGRLALVLPHELTYVRYARPLWKILGECFNDIRLVRVHERLFPDILQEVVILFADGYGGETKYVNFQAIEKASQFSKAEDLPCTALPIERIVKGDRVFLEALLPTGTRELITNLLENRTEPLPKSCVFNIGYVAGDKEFFHPDSGVITHHKLSKACLLPALTSGKQLRACGLYTSDLRCVADNLYFPPNNNSLSAADKRYITYGKILGIHKRYKCAVRKPWYLVPGVRVPDMLLSVFAERPILVINDAKYVASNSLLCGFLKNVSAEKFSAGWYTSLTLLQIELQIHALGGGVLILVPGEVAKIRLPICRPSKSHMQSISKTLMSGSVDSAYRCGDEEILKSQLGLSRDDISSLHDGIQILKHWRNSANGGAVPHQERAIQ